MVGGPAVGKAGDCLDWIAGGLERNELKDFGNLCPIKTDTYCIYKLYIALFTPATLN